MSELFGSKSHTCPMCEGKGSVPDGQKYALQLGEKPSSCSSNEMALVMAMSSEMATMAEKLGVDPTKVKVDFAFHGTGHHMCFMLGK